MLRRSWWNVDTPNFCYNPCQWCHCRLAQLTPGCVVTRYKQLICDCVIVAKAKHNGQLFIPGTSRDGLYTWKWSRGRTELRTLTDSTSQITKPLQPFFGRLCERGSFHTAHFLHNVSQHLNNSFSGRWIGRGGRAAWPARCFETARIAVDGVCACSQSPPPPHEMEDTGSRTDINPEGGCILGNRTAILTTCTCMPAPPPPLFFPPCHAFQLPHPRHHITSLLDTLLTKTHAASKTIRVSTEIFFMFSVFHTFVIQAVHAVSLLASHLCEPGFSHLGIVQDDAAGRRVFSLISRYPLFHSRVATCSLHSPSSALKTSNTRILIYHAGNYRLIKSPPPRTWQQDQRLKQHVDCYTNPDCERARGFINIAENPAARCVGLSNKIPAVISEHVRHPYSFISLLYCHYVLMEPFTIFIRHVTAVTKEGIQLRLCPNSPRVYSLAHSWRHRESFLLSQLRGESARVRVNDDVHSVLTLAPSLAAMAIVSPRNDTVNDINNLIIQRVPGQVKTYKSIDTVTNVDDVVHFPQDFLNSLNPSGLPPHELSLKVDLKENLIVATILTGPAAGQLANIPRIPMIPTDLPISFKRLFINKMVRSPLKVPIGTTQHHENTARQFRALRVKAMALSQRAPTGGTGPLLACLKCRGRQSGDSGLTYMEGELVTFSEESERLVARISTRAPGRGVVAIPRYSLALTTPEEVSPIKAVHDLVCNLETNLRKKSLPLPASILTGALSEMRPVKLVTMDGN
ncbi:hypothetical protein PR048_000286 [Dryococelus australis]|uniref:DNA helicase n=1 Tax=Dryococelus australis TaxID=614101 RepID=A0ABQ9IE79_9NEOP|nr:hypothetical protein PR048_000286 [Dryococelus australis]